LLQGLCHLRVGLRQRLILLLKLREHPYVLDGDHRLVGERLEQGDMLIGEKACLSAGEDNSAEGAALTQHGNGDRASWPLPTRRRPQGPGCTSPHRFDIVRSLDDAKVTNRSGHEASVAGRHWESAADGLQVLCGPSMRLHEVDELPVESEDTAEAGAAQTHAARQNSGENRLNIG